MVIDTVKRAEDTDALVVRLYEAHGGRGRARLSIAWPVREAVRCSLLEDPGEPLDVRDGAIEIPYRPHEIVSVLIR